MNWKVPKNMVDQEERIRELEQEVQRLRNALIKCRVNARMIAAESPSLKTKRIVELVNRALGRPEVRSS